VLPAKRDRDQLTNQPILFATVQAAHDNLVTPASHGSAAPIDAQGQGHGQRGSNGTTDSAHRDRLARCAGHARIAHIQLRA
jgi:hypothetical protein